MHIRSYKHLQLCHQNCSSKRDHPPNKLDSCRQAKLLSYSNRKAVELFSRKRKVSIDTSVRVVVRHFQQAQQYQLSTNLARYLHLRNQYWHHKRLLLQSSQLSGRQAPCLAQSRCAFSAMSFLQNLAFSIRFSTKHTSHVRHNKNTQLTVVAHNHIVACSYSDGTQKL